MRNLNFSDEYFDGLLVAYSLIHIPSEEIPTTLKGFYRVLKPGGHVEVIAQKGESDRTIDEPFMPSQKMFFNFFTKEKLGKLHSAAGFSIVYSHEGNSLDPDSVSDKILYVIGRKEKEV